MTVFVIQEPSPNRNNFMPDLSSAAEYGKLEYVFFSDEQVFADTGNSREAAREVLADFNPKHDYILWPGMGDYAAFAQTINALRDNGVEEFSMLYWNRKRNTDGGRSRTKGFYTPCKL